MKTKTYILTLSTHFPKGHPREGEDTEFAYSFMKALYTEHHRNDDLHSEYSNPHKIHTIRANYDLWKHRIDEVNAGRAVLSVREWLGAPRRSKQRELFRLDKDSGIGVERLEILSEMSDPAAFTHIHIEGIPAGLSRETLANNDGLTLEDWIDWFKGYDRTQPMAIIHFTNFRYCK